MASLKVSFAIDILLALFIVGSQTKPHSPGVHLDPSAHVVHARGIDLALRQDCSGGYLPSGCNVSFSSTNTSDELNAAYSQFCATKCIDSYISYLHNCRNATLSALNTHEMIYKEFYCGKNGDEYCHVSLQRFNVSLLSFCPFSPDYSGLTRINCTSASSTCLKILADFSSELGCCAALLLGNGISSCSGVHAEPPCQYNPTGPPNSTGPTSAAGAIAIDVFPLLLALISAMF